MAISLDITTGKTFSDEGNAAKPLAILPDIRGDSKSSRHYDALTDCSEPFAVQLSAIQAVWSPFAGRQ